MQKNRIQVREVIVVEGRDDTNAVLRAVDALTIETHGFGIRPETWALLETAYREKGLIVFTDPDHAGEEIRRRILRRFPRSKQAFLTQGQARRRADIGIENAAPEDIAAALEKVCCTVEDGPAVEAAYTEDDLVAAGLLGLSDAAERRQRVGAALGIGYGNGKAFLKKLNGFGIAKARFAEAVAALDNGSNDVTPAASEDSDTGMTGAQAAGEAANPGARAASDCSGGGDGGRGGHAGEKGAGL